MDVSVRRGFAALWLSVIAAHAQIPVRFSLDWRWEGPAAPFAVALEKGYFKAEGLTSPSILRQVRGADLPRRVRHLRCGFGDVNSLVRFRDEIPARTSRP